jgi:hypothetical protein
MARTGLAFRAAAGALLLSGAAQAKAPPTGIEVCGAGSCVDLAASEAEMFWMRASGSGRPAAAGAFYVLRWHFDAEPERSAYFIPGRSSVLWLDPRGWSTLEPTAVAALKRTLGDLEPFPAPTLTRVTVGGRAVNAPQTYGTLLRGKPAWVWPVGSWLTVKFQSATPSPWTNGAMTIRLNRSRPYVVIDGWVFRIPKDVAVRARRGLALSG